jgi:putative ABC transport system ATP-binding protein
MLRLEEVTKEYTHRGGRIAALDEVSLEVPEGDFVAIVGPSGSGKTTLLQVLGGMLTPTRGKMFLEGQSVYDLDSESRAKLRGRKIGFVFQTFNLVPYLTALENVQVPLFLAGVEEEEQKERAAGSLEKVGLGDRLLHKPSELSIGQQQRVALARTLTNDPPVILADEPTGNLDPRTSDRTIDFLVELNQEGKTIVMVTHNPLVADRARRILHLEAGRVLIPEPV